MSDNRDPSFGSVFKIVVYVVIAVAAIAFILFNIGYFLT